MQSRLEITLELIEEGTGHRVGYNTSMYTPGKHLESTELGGKQHM